MTLPSPSQQTYTIGVTTHPAFVDHMGDLWAAVYEAFKKEPDEDTQGGTDKFFFIVYFQGVKLYAAVNELNGLTVMLPEEY